MVVHPHQPRDIQFWGLVLVWDLRPEVPEVRRQNRVPSQLWVTLEGHRVSMISHEIGFLTIEFLVELLTGFSDSYIAVNFEESAQNPYTCVTWKLS